MNKTKLVLTAILLLGLATMQAKSDAAQDTNTVNSVELPALLIHFHPITTIFSMSTVFSEESSGAFLYLTLEKPLSQSTSLIIRPNFWRVDNLVLDDNIPLRIGSDFGIRYYLSEKGGYGELGDGYYLQGSFGAFLFRHVENTWMSGEYRPKPETKNEFWFDVMFYVGRSWKFAKVNLSYDVGLGFNSTNNLGGVAYIGDINFCIGIPIGSKKQK